MTSTLIAAAASIDGKAKERITRLKDALSETLDTIEQALQDKAIRDDWAWVFDDTHRAYSEELEIINLENEKVNDEQGKYIGANAHKIAVAAFVFGAFLGIGLTLMMLP